MFKETNRNSKTMKASELRIGNLVYVTDNLTNLIFKEITPINIHNLMHLTGWDKSPVDIEFEPIPLTEEWLEKLGLIKRNQTEELPEELQQPDIDKDGGIWYTWVKGVFNLEIQSNGEIWFELYSHYKHIKWVHELQNLYFALTGEELIN